jgi:plastocyanin
MTAPAATLLVLAGSLAPAHAAVIPQCTGTPTAASVCNIDWNNGFTPPKVRIRAGTSIVWSNSEVTGNVTVAEQKTTPKQTVAFTRVVSAGGNSSGKPDGGPVTFRNTGAQYTEKYQGDPSTPLGVIKNAQIIVVPPPASPPPASSPPAKPPPPHSGKPSPTPSPGTSVLGQGSANNPTLGVGVLPTPGASPPPPPPALALPAIGEPGPTPSETPTVEAAATSLSQPVKARRLGLPGALAAVLVAGVAVGVVRLAKAEYGGNGTNGGNAQPPGPPSP